MRTTTTGRKMAASTVTSPITAAAAVLTLMAARMPVPAATSIAPPITSMPNVSRLSRSATRALTGASVD